MELSGAEAVRMAISDLMKQDQNVLTYGLGVNDPGRVFGTTSGLVEEFGATRVFETPTSELALTGIGVGLAIGGYKVIHSHQRMDFALLAMDQLVNSAAKWRFMFGDEFEVPYLARMIVGRGWGQGPTHSQNFESWFSQVPGLRVMVPATAQNLYDSIRSLASTRDPIVMVEHRWSHHFRAEVDPSNLPADGFLAPEVLIEQEDPTLSIISWGLSIFDALAASKELEGLGINSRIIQVRELSQASINRVVELTKDEENILVAAGSFGLSSYSDSIVAEIARRERGKNLASVNQRFAPEPTSLGQLDGHHLSQQRITNEVLRMLGRTERLKELPPIDQPQGFNFGPF